MQCLQHVNQRATAAFPIILGLLMSAISQGAFGTQMPPAPQVAQESSPPADNNISINVVVTDKTGHPVSGLEMADFTLLDNKASKKILGFHPLNLKDQGRDPVHVIIVIDMINTPFTEVAWERQQLADFLKEDNGRLANPTTLAVFSDRGIALDRQYTVKGSDLIAEFERTQTELRTIKHSSGIWGDAEMLETSLAQLGQLVAYEKAQPGQKMILVVSPGWPLLPQAGSQEGARARQWVFGNIVELTNGLRQARTTLYHLDPNDLERLTSPFYYQTYLKAVTDSENAEYPDLSLQVLSEHTGGETLIGGHDITGKLNTAIRDASASYVLTFEANPGVRANEYHALEVRVNRPELQVRTTAGYYADVQAKPTGVTPRGSSTLSLR